MLQVMPRCSVEGEIIQGDECVQVRSMFIRGKHGESGYQSACGHSDLKKPIFSLHYVTLHIFCCLCGIRC